MLFLLLRRNKERELWGARETSRFSSFLVFRFDSFVVFSISIWETELMLPLRVCANPPHLPTLLSRKVFIFKLPCFPTRLAPELQLPVICQVYRAINLSLTSSSPCQPFACIIIALPIRRWLVSCLRMRREVVCLESSSGRATPACVPSRRIPPPIRAKRSGATANALLWTNALQVLIVTVRVSKALHQRSYIFVMFLFCCQKCSFLLRCLS